MTSNHALTARDAANELGISLPTLYAYVSRGLIHSEPGPEGSRQRRYRHADVLALKDRQAQRRDPAHSVETALDWGTPVLESAITLIEGNRLYYRGHDAIRLARTHQFESVIEILWSDKLVSVNGGPSERHPYERPQALVALGPLERFQAVLPLLASADPAAYDLRPPALSRAGRSILMAMVEELGGDATTGSIAHSLAARWASEKDYAERLIDAALIVSADHELNSSSFTVRCVASVGAPLYDAIDAGICALRGVRHGAASQRVEALLAEVDTPERAPAVLEARLRRGERIPGFGHQLYPGGDPRGAVLIDLCHELAPDDQALMLTDATAAAAEALIGDRPNVDFGLVIVARTLGLDRGSALSLMALGRSAGWVAHALEQYQQNRMIRPRAKYIGPAPIRSVEMEQDAE
ncbi:MAG TPA: citrate synthase family protein [Nitrolancea sp.]|nr:citrate synthase family protein [Nitrolancea sp.]